MEIFKTYYHIVSTSLFVAFIVLAHIFSTGGYDWTKNTISDLGAQGYHRKLIMQIGFLSFGITLATGILLNDITWRTTPIFIYAICIALTGVFCTKPFTNINLYSEMQSTLHSTFAQIAGVAFSMGILTQIFFISDKSTQYIYVLFFALIIGLSAAFGLIKSYRGVVQRVLYLTSFLWLLKYYKAVNL